MGADTVRIEQVARLDAAARAAATALVDEVRVAVGTRPVSDRMWLDLVHDGPTSAGAVLARTDFPGLDCTIPWASTTVRPRSRRPSAKRTVRSPLSTPVS